MINRQGRAIIKATREYLLTGLIECTECGAAYVGHCSVNKRKMEAPGKPGTMNAEINTVPVPAKQKI
jgi:hypothetical protein